MPTSWRCAECDTHNEDAQRPCVGCGGTRMAPPTPETMPVWSRDALLPRTATPTIPIEPAPEWAPRMPAATAPPPVAPFPASAARTEADARPGPDRAVPARLVRPGPAGGGYVPPAPRPPGSRRNPWLWGIAVLVALIAVIVVANLTGHNAANAQSGPNGTRAGTGGRTSNAGGGVNTGGPAGGGQNTETPATNDTTTDTTTAPVTPTDDAATEANAIDQLLDQSGNARGFLTSATADIDSCQVTSTTIDNIEAAASARRELLTRIAATNVADLPNGGTIKSQLTAAINASYAADEAYLGWVNAAGGGCPSHRDSWYNTVNTDNGRATAAKIRFVNTWNPVADQFGLSERDAGSI